MLTAGHGASTLTVIPGETLGGYADRAGGAIGALEPLEVHAVSIHQDGRRMVLLVVDLICINVDLVERIRASLRELGVAAAWVSATHAHSTPESGCFPGGGATPEAVAERVVAAARAATRDAIASERAVRIGAVRVDVDDVGGRRNVPLSGRPRVPVDAIVIETDDAASIRLGLFVVTPVHPTVLGAENRFASADLAGGVRRALAGDAEWVVAATGAAGDISTRATRRARDLAEIDRLAGRVADALRSELEGARTTALATSTLALPRTRALALPVNRVAEDVPVLDEPALSDAFAQRRRAVLEQGIGWAAASRARQTADEYTITIEVFAVGDVRLVAVPAELYLALAERIRAEHPYPSSVIVVGYTNGYLGYLPERDAPVSYETVVSPVERGSGEAVVEAALDQLLRLETDSHVREETA